MEKKEFKLIIYDLAKEIDIILSDDQIDKLYSYMNLLIEWNKKINLTAIIEPKDIIMKHFIDSFTISKHIKKNVRLVDVGTGAGFPGIPLKIIREDIEVVLLDSINKRINFLKEVIDIVKLNKIEAIHSRVEEFGQNKIYRESFDIATSRAVANLATLSEYMIPLVKIGGSSICMKANNISDEIENSKSAIEVLGGSIKKIEEFMLPNTDIKRSVVIIKKIKNTSKIYPRKPGTPSKEPII